MSELSSITLFHFTDRLENLQDILLSGLRSGLVSEKISGRNIAYSSEMICFCDIPLSKIKEHTKWYGKYAIGIRPEFLKEKGVSPVIYTHSKSPFLYKGEGEKACLEFRSFPVLKYLKRCSGRQYKKHTEQFETKRFIDEREWRIVSDCSALVKRFKNLKELKAQTEKEKENLLRTPFYVKIFPKEIEYIIVSSRDELPIMVEWLASHFPDSYQKYLPKILAYSQVERDF